MNLEEALADIPATNAVAVMPKLDQDMQLRLIYDIRHGGFDDDTLKAYGLDPATATLWDKAYVAMGCNITGKMVSTFGVQTGYCPRISGDMLIISTCPEGSSIPLGTILPLERSFPLNTIDSIRVLPPPPPPKTIDEQVKEIPIGKYTLIWLRKKSAGGNPLAEQGKLKSVDEKNRSLVLASTVYPGQTNTVAFDNIEWIDLSRERSGALGPAQTPDLRFVGGGIGGGVWMRGSEIVQGGGGRIPDGTDVSDPLKPLGS